MGKMKWDGRKDVSTAKWCCGMPLYFYPLGFFKLFSALSTFSFALNRSRGKKRLKENLRPLVHASKYRMNNFVEELLRWILFNIKFSWKQKRIKNSIFVDKKWNDETIREENYIFSRQIYFNTFSVFIHSNSPIFT